MLVSFNTLGHELLKYRDLYERVYRIWEDYGEEYRTIVSEYEALLDEKRALGITPLDRIKKSVLDDFPDIEFLDIVDADKAHDYLILLTVGELIRLNTLLDIYLDGYVRRTLKNRIVDFKYAIRYYYSPKMRIGGIDPDTCRNKVDRSRKRSTYHMSDDF